MSETRRFYLPLVGEECAVDVAVPRGEVNVTAVIPAARAVSSAAMARSVAALPPGTKTSCKAGCSVCCSQIIPVSVVEARVLADALEKLPTSEHKRVKARFAAAIAKLEREGWLGRASDNTARRAFAFASTNPDRHERWLEMNRAYLRLRIPCPFLEKDRCTVYANRPFVCREYVVTSDPVHCETLADEVDPVPRALDSTQALNSLASVVEGEEYKAIPLPLVLEWVRHNPAPDVRVDGAELLETWWRVAEASWDEPASS